MPINKKGAPARSSRPVRATAADAARKTGSISPKHRGYRADEAVATEREPKKRWSSDERAARGHSEQRPRGAAASNSARVGRERVERSADGRPNWEPKRAYDGRPTRADRPARGNTAPARGAARDERGNRPQRSYDHRPARSHSDRPARDDRLARSYGDRPQRDDRPARSYGDRPARSFDRDAERPAKSWDRES